MIYLLFIFPQEGCSQSDKPVILDPGLSPGLFSSGGFWVEHRLRLTHSKYGCDVKERWENIGWNLILAIFFVVSNPVEFETALVTTGAMQ